MAKQTKDFARRLRLAMDSANMNQKELAEASGCSQTAVSYYCTGVSTPDEERLTSLAEALGVRPAFLRGEPQPAADRNGPVRFSDVKITLDAASRCLRKSEKCVRQLMIQGCEFGRAVQGTGSHLNYIFFPGKFREYVGAERFDEFFGLIG